MGKTELRRRNSPGNVFMFTHEKYNSWGKKSKKNVLCFQREKIKTLFVFSWNFVFFMCETNRKENVPKMFSRIFSWNLFLNEFSQREILNLRKLFSQLLKCCFFFVFVFHMSKRKCKKNFLTTRKKKHFSEIHVFPGGNRWKF